MKLGARNNRIVFVVFAGTLYMLMFYMSFIKNNDKNSAGSNNNVKAAPQVDAHGWQFIKQYVMVSGYSIIIA